MGCGQISSRSSGKWQEKGEETGQIISAYIAKDEHGNSNVLCTNLLGENVGTFNFARHDVVSVARLSTNVCNHLNWEHITVIGEVGNPVSGERRLDDFATLTMHQGYVAKASDDWDSSASTASDLLASGFTAAELRDAGFTSLQLQSVGCTIMELSSLFELLTIHTSPAESDGQVEASCFTMGGLCVATSRIDIRARLWELLERLEKELGRSAIFLLADGRLVTPDVSSGIVQTAFPSQDVSNASRT